MKGLKIGGKIIIIAILMLTYLLTIGSSKSMAITQPKKAPDGSTWTNWYCAQSGVAYWSLYSYHGHEDDYDYQQAKTISAKTTDSAYNSEGWRVVAYILNEGRKNNTKFGVNHYQRSSHHTGSSYGVTGNDRIAQSALWQALKAYPAVGSTLNLNPPKDGTICTCGNTLYNNAVTNAKKTTGRTEFKFEIEVWKDNLNQVVDDLYYKRQPLMKGKAWPIPGTDTPEIEVKFYKVDENGEGVEGAEIKVKRGSEMLFLGETAAEKKLESGDDGYMGALKLIPKSDSEDDNDGEFNLTITETTVPSGYDGLVGEAKITINYNTSTGAATGVSSDNSAVTVTRSSGTVIVKIKNTEKANQVKVPFVKWYYNRGTAKKRLEGAKLSVTGGSNVKSISTNLYTSGKNGKLRICLCYS